MIMAEQEESTLSILTALTAIINTYQLNIGTYNENMTTFLNLFQTIQNSSIIIDSNTQNTIDTRVFYIINEINDSNYILIPGTEREVCPISLEEFLDDEQLTTIRRCGHTFRKQFILTWLSNNRLCPVCRLELPIQF